MKTIGTSMLLLATMISMVVMTNCGEDTERRELKKATKTDTDTNTDTDPETTTTTLPTSGTTTTTTLAAASGLDLQTPNCESDLDDGFTNVQTAITGSCGGGGTGCHGTGSGSLTLSINASNSAANRTALLAAFGAGGGVTSFATFVSYVVEDTAGHTGGAGAAASLSTTNANAWWNHELAQDAFDTNIQTAITGSCATGDCHNNGDSASGFIELNTGAAGSAAAIANRKTLRDYFTGGSVEDFFDKISTDGQSHGGGDRSGDLTYTELTNWWNAEDNCN